MASKIAEFSSSQRLVSRLPRLVNESLRPALVSASKQQDIVSILLSATDLANLDLSKLELFPVHEQAYSSSILAREIKLDLEYQDDDRNFSFLPTSLLSAAEGEPGTSYATFSGSKSKDDMVADESKEHLKTTKKALSMDEYELKHLSKSEEEGNPQEGDECRGNRKLKSRVPSLPVLEVGKRDQTELKDEKIESQTKINLTASPAAKFLFVAMPWELVLSPITPVTTPIAIPFLWEDVPGRPKCQELPPPFCANASLPLPPRLAVTLDSFSSAGAREVTSTFAIDGKLRSNRSSHAERGKHRKNVHSWHVLQNAFTQSHHQEGQASPSGEEGVRSDSRLQQTVSTSSSRTSSQSSCVQEWSSVSDKESASLLSSADPYAPVPEKKAYDLPPPYVATIVPSTSPYRNLGPAEDNYTKSRSGLRYLTATLFCTGRHRNKQMNSYLLKDDQRNARDRGEWRGMKTQRRRGGLRLRRRVPRILVGTIGMIKRALQLVRRTRVAHLLTYDSQARYYSLAP